MITFKLFTLNFKIVLVLIIKILKENDIKNQLKI